MAVQVIPLPAPAAAGLLIPAQSDFSFQVKVVFVVVAPQLLIELSPRGEQQAVHIGEGT